MLADRIEGADQFMPLSYWIACVVVVVLLLIAAVSYRGMWRRTSSYRPRRAYRWWKLRQRRPGPPRRGPVPEIEDDYARVLPNPMPLAIEGPPVRNPVPYRYASRAQHKEPLPVAEELSW